MLRSDCICRHRLAIDQDWSVAPEQLRVSAVAVWVIRLELSSRPPYCDRAFIPFQHLTPLHTKHVGNGRIQGKRLVTALSWQMLANCFSGDRLMLLEPDHCLRMAEQALRSAEQTSTDDQQKLLLRIAAQWMKLADHVVACVRLAE
jgi:hypothetical protein